MATAKQQQAGSKLSGAEKGGNHEIHVMESFGIGHLGKRDRRRRSRHGTLGLDTLVQRDACDTA
jgi:hypothetical protein